jgi:hypothetical protein
MNVKNEKDGSFYLKNQDVVSSIVYSGKSSTGNSLCAKKVFQRRRFGVGYRTFGNLELCIYDTSGLFFYTGHHLNVIKSEFDLAIRMTSPGPHAFLMKMKQSISIDVFCIS